MLHRIGVRTRSRVDIHEITGEVENAISSSGINRGICYLFVPHTTAGITLNEHADPSVAQDIADKLESLVPRQGNYKHTEGNAAAHIKASLMGSSLSLLIEDGRLVLGTWQGIFLCEFDGPRSRTVYIKLSPDKA